MYPLPYYCPEPENFDDQHSGTLFCRKDNYCSNRLKKVSVFIVTIFLVLALPNSSSCQTINTTEAIGNIMQLAVPAAGYLSTFVFDDPEGRNQFYASFSANLVITYAMKNLVKKTRPNGLGHTSFPSGHTSVAFQGASFLWIRYGWKFGLPASIVACYVGWSRVEGEIDRHYPIDVAAGAALGILSVLQLVKPFQERKLILTPLAASQIYGLSISYHF